MRAVVLDAMGVLYQDGNVLERVLMPYARANGSTLADSEIRAAYRMATLGRMSTTDLWEALGTKADDEGYCQSHRLTPGTVEGLAQLASGGLRLICLSNDAAAWSLILRRRFGLDRYIGEWFISSDLGARKPDPYPYEAVLDATSLAADEIVFVDDRSTNLATARGLGMQTVLFHSDDTQAHGPIEATQRSVRTMTELAATIHELAATQHDRGGFR